MIATKFTVSTRVKKWIVANMKSAMKDHEGEGKTECVQISKTTTINPINPYIFGILSSRRIEL